MHCNELVEYYLLICFSQRFELDIDIDSKHLLLLEDDLHNTFCGHQENRKENGHTEGGERLTEGTGSKNYEKGNDGTTDLTSITRGIKEVEAHRRTTKRRNRRGNIQ